jgi:hypothetical protein
VGNLVEPEVVALDVRRWKPGDPQSRIESQQPRRASRAARSLATPRFDVCTPSLRR